MQMERMCKAPLARGNVVTDKSPLCGWSEESRDLTLPLERDNAREVDSRWICENFRVMLNVVYHYPTCNGVIDSIR